MPGKIKDASTESVFKLKIKSWTTDNNSDSENYLLKILVLLEFFQICNGISASATLFNYLFFKQSLVDALQFFRKVLHSWTYNSQR